MNKREKLLNCIKPVTFIQQNKTFQRCIQYYNFIETKYVS